MHCHCPPHTTPILTQILQYLYRKPVYVVVYLTPLDVTVWLAVCEGVGESDSDFVSNFAKPGFVSATSLLGTCLFVHRGGRSRQITVERGAYRARQNSAKSSANISSRCSVSGMYSTHRCAVLRMLGTRLGGVPGRNSEPPNLDRYLNYSHQLCLIHPLAMLHINRHNYCTRQVGTHILIVAIFASHRYCTVKRSNCHWPDTGAHILAATST
ncbi:hypothetical protein V8E53_005991, partial [Lactarius tabidus]